MKKVKYKGEEYELVFNCGKVWVEPEEGPKFEIGPDGIEYDLTDYVEDESWLIRNIKNGEDSIVYKSECRIIN